jgi:hypothetical protein
LPDHLPDLGIEHSITATTIKINSAARRREVSFCAGFR